jgi:ATP-binding cassette, subfamily B, multidrug efflux pump
MFGGPDGMRRLMSQDNIKPKKIGQTMARFGRYFRPFWFSLVIVIILVVISTWTQVTIPALLGQATDCYLIPGAVGGIGNFSIPGVSSVGANTATATNCWLSPEKQPENFTQSVVRRLMGIPSGVQSGQTPASQGKLTSLAGLTRLTLVVVLFFVMGAILTGLSFFTMSWAGNHVLRDMREDLYQHLLRLSLGYYGEHEAGDLMSRITNDSETIQQAISFALLNVFSGILLLVWVAFEMVRLSPVFALLSLIVTPLMIVATVWFSGQARKAFRRARERIGSVNAELQESISAVREVQAFNRADENIENFRVVNAANRDANVRAVAFTSALGPSLEALGYVALAIVAGVGGAAILNGGQLLGTTVSLGLVITFIAYVQRFNQPIQQIALLWTNLQNAIAGGERIFNLMDVEPEIVNKPGALEMPPITGEVIFDNVCATYRPGQPVLSNVTFQARAGQMIAIVGPTGAGKTTIINLIPRFYDVCDGFVKIDGLDVRDVTTESLRRQIGIVLQDTFLFSANVLENIRYGRPDATDDEVLEAAKLARVDTFIERLPDGYQTVLGERGSGLSQGQRQLISIARAALANPRILILDEATSSVDTRTERLIQKALNDLMQGRTSFVIAHRLSTIRNADVVLVIDQGQLIERGRHDELLAKKGFYYKLYMSQFSGGEEAPPQAGGNGYKTSELTAAS